MRTPVRNTQSESASPQPSLQDTGQRPDDLRCPQTMVAGDEAGPDATIKVPLAGTPASVLPRDLVNASAASSLPLSRGSAVTGGDAPSP